VHRRLDLLVRVDRPLAGEQPDVADRGRTQQLTSSGLVELALIHPLLEDMKLRLAHHPVQAEQEAVVVIRRIIQAVGVGQECPEACTQFQEMMPILARASQPAHLQAEDQADAVQGYLNEQALEAEPALDGLSAPAQVVVDDVDLPGTPAEIDGPIGQGVLASGRLLMVDDLLGGGLPDVHDGPAVEVPVLELGRTGGVIHDRPPRDALPRGDGRAACRGVRGVAASCRRAVGSRGAPDLDAGSMGPGPSGAGGSSGGGASGVGHAISPVDSVRCCRHHAASSSSAAISMVTGHGVLPPPLA
jgi:hypothetical protein